MQTFDPFSMIADHPISKRLATHAHPLHSSLAAHPVENIRNGQELIYKAAIDLASRRVTLLT